MCGQWSRSLVSAVAVFPMVIVGCSGGQSGPAIYPVKGIVLVNGAPAEYATVSLTPVDATEEQLPAGGIVNADGEFRLTTLKPFDGAEPGEYFVSISWQKPINPNVSELDYGPELLPAKYQNPAKSGLDELRVVIEAKKNELPTFELKR